MDPTTRGSLIVAGATLAGMGLAELLEWLRSNRQRQRERALLAGAVAAEIRGVIGRWRRVESVPARTQDRSAFRESLLAADSIQQNYFSFFEGAGHQLCLLPKEVVAEVVECYVSMKAVFDRLRGAMETLQGAASATGNVGIHFGNAASAIRSDALTDGAQVFEKAESLAARLESISAERSVAARLRFVCGRVWRRPGERVLYWRRRPPQPPPS